MITIDERIELSKSKINEINSGLQTLLQVHANNDVILYSKNVSGQVGKSYAAHAFNVLQGVMFEGELVRICALWDAARNEKEAQDRNSIPAVAWLLNSNDVIEKLRRTRVEDRERKPFEGLNLPEDAEERRIIEGILARRHAQQAIEEGSRVLTRWDEVKKKIDTTQGSKILKGLKHFRDKHIAHSLMQTGNEKKGIVAQQAEYGDASKLLDTSIEIAQNLYYVTLDASFDWEGAKENAERYATALWSGCKLNIKE